VKAYGTSGGYGWKLNEIIGAQLVAVPMAVPVAMAKSAFHTLLTTLVAVFVVTLLILNVLLSVFVIRPLKLLARTADRVSTGDLEAPDVVLKEGTRWRPSRLLHADADQPDEGAQDARERVSGGRRSSV